MKCNISIDHDLFDYKKQPLHGPDQNIAFPWSNACSMCVHHLFRNSSSNVPSIRTQYKFLELAFTTCLTLTIVFPWLIFFLLFDNALSFIEDIVSFFRSTQVQSRTAVSPLDDLNCFALVWNFASSIPTVGINGKRFIV